MAGSAFLRLEPGTLVSAEGQRYRITHVLGVDSVLARNLATDALDRLFIGSFQRDIPPGEESAPQPEIQEYAEEAWKTAQRRFAIIQPLLADPFRTRGKVQEAAAAAGVHVDTVYDWIRSYLQSERLSSLIPRKRGRKAQSRYLAEPVETIITVTIQDTFLTKEQKTPLEVIEAVQDRCKEAGVRAPHPNTVRNRLSTIEPKVRLRRRGRADEARNRYEPIQGSYDEAQFPLSVVQIDHTPVNVIVVEEQTRLPLGRPHLTLAIDVFSRMVTGYYLSMEKPGAMAVGMCIAQGMLPKQKLLAELEVPGSWPVWGKPRCFHVDNAKEFRGLMMERACQQYGIDLQFRPVQTPHFGGHIERLMGTAAAAFFRMPGKTFASPHKRKGYDPEKESALTLRELEQLFVDFLVNRYHEKEHGSLGIPPKRRWQKGLAGDETTPSLGLPDIPADPERLRLDFLPFVPRTVQPYGLLIDHIFYYHEVLNPWINATEPDHPEKKREFIIRRDYEDLSRVYFYDPELKQYFAIPYRDSKRPPINIWELRAVIDRLKKENRENIDEEAIFESRRRETERINTAVTKTKAARRALHRLRNTAVKAKVASQVAHSPELEAAEQYNLAHSTAQAEQSGDDDLFSKPVCPFDDVDLNL